MGFLIYFKGLFLGLALCVPLGPIGVLALKRTLSEGKASGLASLLGSTLSDAFYCSLAGFGIAYIGTFLDREHLWIEIMAGLVLVLVGSVIYRTEPSAKPRRINGAVHRAEERADLAGSFFSTFLITLTNPLPFLVFTAAFGAMGVHGWRGDYLRTAVFLAGMVTGSALWAPILVMAGQRIGEAFTHERRARLNRISGTIIALFGLAMGCGAILRSLEWLG